MMHLLTEALPYDPNQVTPGVIGFFATLLVASLVMLLMWDFNRRVRRINNRAEAQERLQAEVATAEASASEHGQAGGAPATVEPLESNGDSTASAR